MGLPIDTVFARVMRVSPRLGLEEHTRQNHTIDNFCRYRGFVSHYNLTTLITSDRCIVADAAPTSVRWVPFVVGTVALTGGVDARGGNAIATRILCIWYNGYTND